MTEYLPCLELPGTFKNSKKRQSCMSRHAEIVAKGVVRENLRQAQPIADGFTLSMKYSALKTVMAMEWNPPATDYIYSIYI